ncbi:basic form of pathogenesis-related protein 1-like [Momordica charantia]|uniref:Basic form of pathogenesis-related protein 1-like n=1 Tax=Momordica charantia TaxID=3673 RepID=A0A6J1D646_MOMCH|nr:basic form of pathogenesis-related protein 1-like [Momordica charantia]
MAVPKSASTICLVGLTLALTLTMTATVAVANSSPKDFVDVHNAIRAENGVGPVAWNTTLADYAENFAKTRVDTCEMEHSMGPYAENLAEAFESTTAEATVKFWATEKEFYDPKANKCVNDECGHFMNVVGKDTKYIGCAEVRCKNNYIFTICNYS